MRSKHKRVSALRWRARWERAMAVAIMVSLTASLLMVPAAARSTYIIHDGDAVRTYATFRRDARQVLLDAGIALGAGDTFTALEADDGLHLTVVRRQSIRIYADGEVTAVETYGEPVGQVLETLGIRLDGDDRVSVGLDTPTVTGMTVVITRVHQETVTYEQVIPAEEDVYLNTVLAPGAETVLQEGADGLKTVEALVTYEDGVEVSRQVTAETVVTPAQPRVVIRGAEEAAMPADAEGDAILAAGGEVLEYTHVIDGMATAYNCPGYVGTPASGTVAQVGQVAVDPRVIPLGTRLYIVSQDGQYVYGYCVAEDTGGLIKGNKVDLYFNTWDECIQFGYRPVTIYVLE